MSGKPKKSPREKDLTSRYFGGGFDEDRVEQTEQFKARNKTAQHDKMQKTADLRADGEQAADIETLPIGEVVQVFSLFSAVEFEGKVFRCVVRRTMTRLSKAFIVVGDRVRFRETGIKNEGGDLVGGLSKLDSPPDGVIEEVLPRRSVLTRADSFKGLTQHPIIANADQVLIVASIRQPYIKWGLVDRMLVAAEAGKLKPIVCLNKIDLAAPGEDGTTPEDLAEADAALGHYQTLGITTLRTSIKSLVGLESLRDVMRGKTTVLAGHSGVGKSSLVQAIEPGLDIRIGDVSRYTDKGRHTTTSARRYPLSVGGLLIDTPGVKQFGLWGVTRDNLEDFFPDVANGTAPPWRKQSFERLMEGIST